MRTHADKTNDWAGIGVVVLVLFAFFSGLWFGSRTVESEYQREAVKRGHATVLTTEGGCEVFHWTE